MSPKVFAEFGRVLDDLGRSFESVLEVGALPDERSLLLLPGLRAARQRVGVNLNEEGVVDGAQIVRGDARQLSFPDASFDLVLSSSTLEHIPDFWRATAEMKRVLKPSGVFLVCVPGYVQSTVLLSRLQRMARRFGSFREFRRMTVTFGVHDYPHDYYRFSEEAMRRVILEDLEDINVWSAMTPPRLFGVGIKVKRTAPELGDELDASRADRG